MGDTLSVTSGARYRILGPVSVRGKLKLGAPKQRAVLAALLLNANRMVSEEQLFSLVWGERTPRSVLGRVRVYVHELRSLLGRDVIARVRAGYRIQVEPGELDLDMFDEAVAAARIDALDGRPADAAARLREALSLWTGPALGGASASLVEREGSVLEERRLGALEELFDAELAAGRHVQVVGELHKAAADQPLRERLQAQLMLALYRSERRSEALNVYFETHHRLVEELGIEPGQTLREIHREILDSGEQPTAAPEPASARPAELPRDIRGFAGRDAELKRLDVTALDGGICVISGTAGVGKSALAVHWAHSVRDHFPDGQLYVNLRGYDPDYEPLTQVAAVAQLLHSLGVAPAMVPDGLDRQTGLYRSLLADRRVLVLLDNARDAEQVRPLLPPYGVALVTSRQRLGDLVVETGAHRVSLTELSGRDSQALLAGVLGKDIVAAEADACAELAQLCGGLPLALRIAAANVATVPGSGIAPVVAELASGDRLAGLAVDGAADGAVTVAFSLSYRALTPRSQQVFRMIGMIPGPDFTVPVAAAAAGRPAAEVAQALKALSAANLIDRHTADRYRFHDLVRLYAAREAKADPDHWQAEARLTDYYVGIANAGSQ
jgi:DNA-binding SARP family transcriptional activator